VTNIKYINTPSIILKCSRLKDTSASVTALTPDIGIINFTKYGYNSKKNDTRAILQPLNFTELQLEIKKDRAVFKECSLTDNFEALKSDYKKTICATELAASIIRLNIYDIKDYSLIFLLLRKFLETLCKKESDSLTLTAYFYFQLAWCLGISITFNDESKGSIRFFRYSDGTLTSGGPITPDEGYRLSERLFETLLEFSRTKFADSHKISYITTGEFREFCDMYSNYTGYHLGNPIVIGRSMIGEV